MTAHPTTTNDRTTRGETDSSDAETPASVTPPSTTKPVAGPTGTVASMARALAAAYASRKRVLRRGALHAV